MTADGDITFPLPALTAGTTYTWSAIATSVAGYDRSRGTFRTEALIVMPRPTLVPAVATYGARHDLRHDPEQARVGSDAG